MLPARANQGLATSETAAVLPASDVDQSSESSDRFVTPERLYIELDGQDVSVSGGKWRVEVFSIRDQAGHRWVQLGLRGTPGYTLTLRLCPGGSARHAILTLSSWLANPSTAGDVVSFA